MAGTLDPCKTGNTHKNQPEVYFCVLDGEATPLRVWGRLSLAFPTNSWKQDIERQRRASLAAVAVGPQYLSLQCLSVFKSLLILCSPLCGTLGPDPAGSRQVGLMGTARTEGPGMPGEAERDFRATLNPF